MGCGSRLFSGTCLWDGLDGLVAVKSKLRWQGPVAYDDE